MSGVPSRACGPAVSFVSHSLTQLHHRGQHYSVVSTFKLQAVSELHRSACVRLAVQGKAINLMLIMIGIRF